MPVTSAWTEGHPRGAGVCPACPPAFCLCPSLGCSGRTSVPAPRVPGANHTRTKAQTPACLCSVKAPPWAVPCPELNPHTAGAESSHPSRRWSVTWLCTGRALRMPPGMPPGMPFVRVPEAAGTRPPGQPCLGTLSTGLQHGPTPAPRALSRTTSQSPAGTAGERIHQQPCPGRGPACHQRGDPPTGSSAQRAQDPLAGWGPPWGE